MNIEDGLGCGVNEQRELSYRRGFIQGIQFVLNSLRQGCVAEDVEVARTFMHEKWRCLSDAKKEIRAPMSVKELKLFKKNGWPEI
jgi:hypothetical protein